MVLPSIVLSFACACSLVYSRTLKLKGSSSSFDLEVFVFSKAECPTAKESDAPGLLMFTIGESAMYEVSLFTELSL